MMILVSIGIEHKFMYFLLFIIVIVKLIKYQLKNRIGTRSLLQSGFIILFLFMNVTDLFERLFIR